VQGHDTTAAGSSFVLCLLGVHQDIQARVYDELYEIFGDSDRPVTFADTLRMKYLERVILESLRMYPPVPIIARKLNRDVKIGKISIHTYIPLTLYPKSIDLRYFVQDAHLYVNDLALRDTADEKGGKPITVRPQSFSGVKDFIPLVAFYNIYR
jgi:cytochrome P450